MKKFVSILLAVLFVLSAVSVMSFAEDPAPAATEPTSTSTTTTTTTAPEKIYKCDFCDATFATTTELKTHIDATFPVPSHFKACDNADKGCTAYFHTRVGYEAHMKECEYNDTRSDFEKAVDALKAGDFLTALKILANLVIDFVKSDDFKKITDKVVEFVKGIDFNKIKSAVTDVVDKLPLDKIEDLVK